MSLSEIRIREPIDSAESITLALAAFLEFQGHWVAYDDLNAALGLSFLICLATDELDPLVWTASGRDFCIADGLAPFGLHVRELHPPEATAGLAQTPEFADHFADSYVPLIRASLHAGQPVLAWQGWPENGRLDWGLITSEATGPFGLAGVTPANEDPVPLVAPAVQCYVLEPAASPSPDPATLLNTAMTSALVALGEGPDPPAGLITGPDAFDVWMATLHAAFSHQAATKGVSIAHAAFTRNIIENRRSAVRFLHSVADQTRQSLRELLDRLVSQMAHTAGALRMLGEPAMWTPESFETEGLGIQPTSIRRAQSSDRAAIETITELRRALHAQSAEAHAANKI